MHSTPQSVHAPRSEGAAISRATKTSRIELGLFNVLFVLGSAVVVLFVLAFPNTAMVVGAWVALMVAVKVLGPSAVSPALIVALGLGVVAAAGMLLYPIVQDAPNAAGIRLVADPDLMGPGFFGLTLASLGVSVGAIIAGILASAPRHRRATGMPRQMSPAFRSVLVIATAIPTGLLVAMRGVDSLLERSTYLPPGSGSGLAGLLAMAGTVAMAVCGYLLHTHRGLSRILVLANIAVFTLYFVSTGSRRLAAVPLLLAAGYYVATRSKRARRLVAFGVVATLLIVPLPLYWRTLDSHGLIPYLDSLRAFFSTGLGIDTAAKTILVSLPITGATARSSMPEGSLWAALNPRGGRDSGWYEIAELMRLNAFTPMSGVGELLAHGAIYVAVFFLLVGLYLGFLDRHVRRLIARGHHLPAFAHVGLAALFLAYVIQYNLRPSVRMIYYSIALWGAYTLWRSLTTRPRQPQIRPRVAYSVRSTP